MKSDHLPVHIVEQHNDVVPFIHRAIASKQLPFSGIPIIHLDSHPDLLIPFHLDADTIFKPQELYEAQSIENWLLPLTYAKHIDHVIWVKPPWANQIAASEQSFSIGKCHQTGKLRLSSKENYFLTDGLYCSPQDLRNTVECKLTVLELKPEKWQDLDLLCSKSNLSSQNVNENNSSSKDTTSTMCEVSDSTNKTTQCETEEKRNKMFNNYKEWTQLLQDVIVTKPYILDVDLDFFSTKNPFREEFQSEKEIVQRLFKCPVLIGSSDKEIETFTSDRRKQLNQLEILFTSLNEKWSEDDDLDDFLFDDSPNISLADLTGLDAEELKYFTPDQEKDIESLCKSVLPNMRQREISFNQIFDFGCTLDDTELPHHVSSDDQIEALAQSFRSVLENLPKPTIVTISRSSFDDYCPTDQVDKIEAMVLKMLTDIHGSLNVTRNYDK